MDRALEDFSMEACKKAELYPDIWDYLEEEEEIKDDIRTSFIKMKDFYKNVHLENRTPDDLSGEGNIPPCSRTG